MGWLLFLLLYSLAFGTVTAISAKSKNRDTVIWFIVGLVFGVFGLIASLVIEKNQNTDASENEIRKMKKCPDCAEEIFLEARICRYCGKKFNENEIPTIKSDDVNDPNVLQGLINKLNQNKK